MKQCPYCNAAMDDKSLYCGHCGKPYSQKTVNSGNTGYLKYVIAAVTVAVILGLAAIGGVAWWFFNKTKTGPTLSQIEANVSDRMDEPGREEAITKRIKTMFDSVYSSDDGYTDADAKWLSAEYNRLIEEEAEVTESSGAEMGFFDSDHWVQGQDCEKPSMTVLSVEMISDEKSIAKIKIKPYYNQEYYRDLKLVLVHERGDWYIDDFVSIYDGKEVSEKTELKDYIANERQNSRTGNTPMEDDSYDGNISSSSSRTFQSEQLVIGYLANQSFRASDGLTMKIDGSGRLYVDGDYAGVLSVLRYNSTSALLRYGGGMYGEGKLTVQIVGDKFTLTDPTDGTVYYQR